MAHDWTVMGTPLGASAADADMAELIRDHEKDNLAFFNGRAEPEASNGMNLSAPI